MNRVLHAALQELHREGFTDEPIPRCIHLTVRCKRSLSKELQANIARIRQLNPDWTLTVYDDQDIAHFLAQHFGAATLSVYRRLNPRYGAARADLFRYLCLHRLGGLYLDAKSTTLVPLSQWLKAHDRFILSQWDNGPQGTYSDWGLHKDIAHIPGGEYQQWFIAAAAGHPYLRATCERVIRNILSHRPMPAHFGRMGVLRVTGPIAYSLAIHPILDQHPHRFVDVEGAGWMSYSFFPRSDDHITRLGDTHYSLLSEPIVQLSKPGQGAFALARGTQQHALRVQQGALRLLVALRRHLPSLTRLRTRARPPGANIAADSVTPSGPD